MHKRLVVLFATALLAPEAAVAQSPAPRSLGLDSRTLGELQTLVVSQDSIRVEAAWGQVIIRRPSLTTDSLLAAPDNSGVAGPRVSLGDVTRIQVWRGASGTGALVGAGVGLAGGLAASIGLSKSLCSDGGCANESGGYAVITLGSTVAGALLGALIGGSLKNWRTIYRSR